MAATFLKAQGKPVGASLVEDDLIDYAARLMRSRFASIHLPVDVVAASEISANPSRLGVFPVDEMPPGLRILDVGPKTVERFCRLLDTCGTAIWNGPLGVFELTTIRLRHHRPRQPLGLGGRDNYNRGWFDGKGRGVPGSGASHGPRGPAEAAL